MTEMSDPTDAEERDRRLQIEGERRLGPYLEALHMRVGQILKSVPINRGELTLVFPRSEWEDLELKDDTRVLGCRIVFADVPTVMVAVPVPKARVAYATLGVDAETGEPT
jgi:hypothetical protein